MSALHAAIAGYLDGLKTSIDRLKLDDQNQFAEGYRAALDDIAQYVDEVEAGLIEERVAEESRNRTKGATS
jgi:hypothetical protein